MTQEHVELILEELPGIDRERFHERLRARGFEPLPMKVGVLVAGTVGALRALVPTLSGTQTDEVSIPSDLQDAVRSIRVVKPKSLHSP
jgi:hypothetical protein